MNIFRKDIHENLQSINIDETPVICAYICTALMMLYSNLHSFDDVYMCCLGHFIHFMADGAFQDLNINLLGYFNNCQFPNVVYKALTCFKCSSKGSQICSLGHEVSEFGKVLLSVILWYSKGSLDHEVGNLSRV